MPVSTAGKHAGAAGRRRGDDDAHRRVHFLHGQRAHQHVAKERAGERARWTVLQLRRVAADESRRGKQIAGFALSDRVAHDVQRAAELRPNVGDRAAGVFGLGAERDRGQRHLLGFGGGDRGGQ